MLATPFLPIWEKASPDRIERVALTGFEMLHSRTDPAKGEVVIQQKNEYHIAFMCFAGAAMCVYVSLQGRNRLKQMKLGIANSVILASSAVSIFFAIQLGEKWFDPLRQGQNLVGLYLPFLALLLNMISNRLIRRDDNLVRSMNRMR